MISVLTVIDMQNDFVTGSLGSAEAAAIVPEIKKLLDSFSGKVYFTRDTHTKTYISTQEGQKLPVEHCIKGEWGWQIIDELKPFTEKAAVVDKPAFGSADLAQILSQLDQTEGIGEIILAGLCTDICVISNALLLKAFLPEVPISVRASCCAGITPDSHQNALSAMKLCHISIIP